MHQVVFQWIFEFWNTIYFPIDFWEQKIKCVSKWKFLWERVTFSSWRKVTFFKLKKSIFSQVFFSCTDFNILSMTEKCNEKGQLFHLGKGYLCPPPEFYSFSFNFSIWKIFYFSHSEINRKIYHISKLKNLSKYHLVRAVMDIRQGGHT